MTTDTGGLSGVLLGMIVGGFISTFSFFLGWMLSRVGRRLDKPAVDMSDLRRWTDEAVKADQEARQNRTY